MLVYHVIISCYIKCDLLLSEVSELIAWFVVWLLCSGDHCSSRRNYSSVSCLRTDACDTDLSPTATSAGEYTPQTHAAYYLRQRGYVLRGVCLLVCLSVCVSVCLLVASCKNYWSYLHGNSTEDVSVNNEELATDSLLEVI